MNRNYSSRLSKKQEKGKRTKRFVILLVCIVSMILIWNILSGGGLLQSDTNTQNTNTFRSPLGEIVKDPITVKKAELSETIEPFLENELGEYSIYIEHLQNGDTYVLSPDRPYISASLYKLWVMGAVYEKLEAGTLTKERVMSDEIPKINERFNIASESAERTEGEISMSIGQALDEMITVSHNYAALLLSQTVTLSSTRQFMEEYGYDDSFLDPPTTTARDVAKFYKQLYHKEIVTPSASDEMMILLKNQEWNDRIPKYLPEDTIVAHKTGELVDVKHDAGIVFTDKGDYIIVLMSETPSQENAAEVEAKISEAVYGYFTE